MDAYFLQDINSTWTMFIEFIATSLVPSDLYRIKWMKLLIGYETGGSGGNIRCVNYDDDKNELYTEMPQC